MVDVSVIVPTFRRPRELLEALHSIRRQIEVEWEAIVVDDSPEAGAREVVSTFNDSRVSYLANPNPTGGFPSRVRNLGWPLARGRLLHFLDDDDLAPPGLYAWAEGVFRNHPDAGVAFGRVEPFGSVSDEQLANERRFFADAARRAAACSRFGAKWGFSAQMIFDRALLVCGAAIVRRECVSAVGGFDPDLRLREDLDFFARMVRKFGAHYDDRVTLRYRIGAVSLMHAPALADRDLQDLHSARRNTQDKFLSQYGATEYYTLKLFNRLIMRRI
jgi:glycosyltransferase involved in cell wall biosynthesis